MSRVREGILARQDLLFAGLVILAGLALGGG
jgi:hypothetical protein